ncbi:hypothetical protein BDD12DRAFT_807047 [Trichophaea hybrida]|nr:hypothetical protein BDD12DRAFT_807047 [Trichophaea hybrida]
MHLFLIVATLVTLAIAEAVQRLPVYSPTYGEAQLDRRQDSCIGMELCNFKCIPLGAVCCSDGDYCFPGEYCMTGDDGQLGCCPSGRVCGGAVKTRPLSTTNEQIPTFTHTKAADVLQNTRTFTNTFYTQGTRTTTIHRGNEYFPSPIPTFSTKPTGEAFSTPIVIVSEAGMWNIVPAPFIIAAAIVGIGWK